MFDLKDNFFPCFVYDNMTKKPVTPLFLSNSIENAKISFIDWYVRSEYLYKDACELKLLEIDISIPTCDNPYADYDTLIDVKEALNELDVYNAIKEANQDA